MTTPDELTINLDAAVFGERERLIASWGGLAVHGFRYAASGLEALRIVNAVGEIVVLPYHGQQIWDATFHGRRLTMKSVFDEPERTGAYLRNYGAFLVHCGISAMGNPAPEDIHPLHGEIPNARLQTAALRFGTGPDGPYVVVAGERRERVAFQSDYSFLPEVRLEAGSSRIELVVRVVNHRSTPMDLMYLAHVNFRPVDGARIVDATPDDPAHFRVRRHLPIYRNGTPEYRALMDEIAAQPANHRDIVPGRLVAPELVGAMDCVAGPDGWAHALQVLPDGSADFISHRPGELPKAVRWMTRNGDEDALGLVLPATAEADGKSAESKKGNVRKLAPGAEYVAHLSFGSLSPAEAAELRSTLEATRAGSQ